VCAQGDLILIDSAARIEEGARLHNSVTVGAYSYIGKDVEIDEGTHISPHVTITGHTSIGRNNRIFQYSSLGEEPQDLTYKGEPTRLVIGDNNIIREFCTLNRGTVNGGSETRLGNNIYIMAYAHIAHDCQLGNNIMLVNGASLAGHVHVDDGVVLSGFTLIHQFVSVGRYAFCGVGSRLSKDLPPYVRVSGNPAKPFGINIDGLKRRNYDPDVIGKLKKAYKILYKSKLTLEKALLKLDELRVESDEVGHIADFIRNSKRSIVR